MFFRRQKPRVLAFSERLEKLRQAAFSVRSEGNRAVVARDGCAAFVEEDPGGSPKLLRLGIVIGSEIGALVDGGYQKFLRTPSGRREPALAAQLRSLHSFEEDLREHLGLTSLYNQSLGTVNDAHFYDRVVGRDRGVPPRPWER